MLLALWYVGYPELCPLPNCKEPLNPASNLTLQVINGLVSESATLFPYGLLHLGGDEVRTD